MMALVPAYHMARELPTERQPLPVLKVLYRNSNRIQEKGGRKDEVLRQVPEAPPPSGSTPVEALKEAAHHQDIQAAEGAFAVIARQSPEEAYNDLLMLVHEGTEVHRVVLAYRAWDILSLVGKERAHTLLRQSVHYCVRNENESYRKYHGQVRTLLPKLLDQYRLAGRPLGQKEADDHWVDELSQTFFRSSPEQAADAAAAALAEGFSPEAVGEAICLAANQLVLRDNGRKKQYEKNKPVGSCHGDSIGVHGSDSANAWRNIARVSNARNAFASLILGAYQIARDRAWDTEILKQEPYPRADAREKVKATDAAGLLREAEAAIKDKDQAHASSAVHRYGELGFPARPVFDLLLRYAISEDGALHAEKYYRTASEEFARTRAPFRWRQLTALARVTASAYGYPAPGYAEACGLLKV
jgi:hypothetical protein